MGNIAWKTSEETPQVENTSLDPRSAPTKESERVATPLTRPQSSPYALDRHSTLSRRAEHGRHIFSNFQNLQSETAEKWLKEKKSGTGGIAGLLKAASPRLALKYNITAAIACGMSAVVCKGIQVSTGKPVAIKFMRLSGSNTFEAEMKRRACVLEAEIQIECSHPNIVALYDFSLGERYAIYIMEYVPETLLGAIVKRNAQQRYSESETAKYIRDVARALANCHSHGIVHLDVKLDNVLCTSSGVAKLCDFGVAARLNGPFGKVKRSHAAPMFCPPEILRDGCCDTKADMWALGVVLYMLLCGYPCFPEKNLNSRILDARYSFPEKHWSDISVMARDLVSRLLVLDTKKRYSAKQVLEHPWIKALDYYETSDDTQNKESPPHKYRHNASFYQHSNKELVKVMKMPKKVTKFLRELHVNRTIEKRALGKGVSKLMNVWGKDILDSIDKSIDDLSDNLAAIDSESYIATKFSPFAQQFLVNRKKDGEKSSTSGTNSIQQESLNEQKGDKPILLRQKSFCVLPEEPLTWIDDSEAKTCRICDRFFTLTFRRHHCRNCGQIICENCSRHRLPVASMDESKVYRICDLCFAQIGVPNDCAYQRFC